VHPKKNIKTYCFSLYNILFLIYLYFNKGKESNPTKEDKMKVQVTMQSRQGTFFVIVKANSVCAALEKAKKMHPEALWVHYDIIR
jgi:hypothetical protein